MSRSFIAGTEEHVLNAIFGTPTYTPHPGNLKIDLSQDFVDESGSYLQFGMAAGGYLSQSITFGAASGGVVSNTNTITFPTATAPWGKIVAWLVTDGTSFQSLAAGYMGTRVDSLWSIYGSSGSPANTVQVFGASAPASGSRVFFTQKDPDGNSVGFLNNYGPSPFDDGSLTEYWSVNQSGPNFQLALTQGGAPIVLSNAPQGERYGNIDVWLSKAVTVNAGDTLVFPPGSISISLK